MSKQTALRPFGPSY